jgi:hypothetical protein
MMKCDRKFDFQGRFRHLLPLLIVIELDEKQLFAN